MTVFALVSLTTLVSPSELYRLGQALEVNAAHCAKAYSLERPQIVVIDDVGRNLSKLPPGCFPLLFVDEADVEGTTLGQHWYNYHKQIPVGRVMVHHASGLNTGSHSVCEIASHEITEAMVNPMLDKWWPHPTRPGVSIAYECADPTQDHYEIESFGTPWRVSNFVTPMWFARQYVGRPDMVRELIAREGYGLDWCGRMTVPGQIGSEGYAVMRSETPDGGFKRWSEDIFGAMDAKRLSDERRAELRHPLSRSRKLGVRA